jgi:N6-adenosine-specific RNA methylase IME4
MEKYKVILADPPWAYRDSRKKGGKAWFGSAAQYPTMSLGELCDLPVRDIADKDCILFLWVTSPLLPYGFELMDAWGFTYKTVAFCWNKKTKTGKDVSNLGQWTCGNVELCLLGTKGKPRRIAKNIKQLVKAERTKHSRKPAEVRERIVDLMGDVPRVELFATQECEGWDGAGFDLGVSISDFIRGSAHDKR